MNSWRSDLERETLNKMWVWFPTSSLDSPWANRFEPYCYQTIFTPRFWMILNILNHNFEAVPSSNDFDQQLEAFHTLRRVTPCWPTLVLQAPSSIRADPVLAAVSTCGSAAAATVGWRLCEPLLRRGARSSLGFMVRNDNFMGIEWDVSWSSPVHNQHPPDTNI
jgi:hypothetical protein